MRLLHKQKAENKTLPNKFLNPLPSKHNVVDNLTNLYLTFGFVTPANAQLSTYTVMYIVAQCKKTTTTEYYILTCNMVSSMIKNRVQQTIGYSSVQ